MRFHLTSVDRAKSVARRLRDILGGEPYFITVTQTQARTALALMLGYGSWTELLKTTERADTPPTPFDELLEPHDLDARLTFQMHKLVETIPSVPQAYWVVARLRATAHPAGPHRLAGPSSSLDGVPVEQRGRFPDGIHLTFRDGELSGLQFRTYSTDEKWPWETQERFEAYRAAGNGGHTALASQVTITVTPAAAILIQGERGGEHDPDAPTITP